MTPIPEKRATATAVLASCKPLYVFIASLGTPQSAQDIIQAAQGKQVLSNLLAESSPELDLSNVAVEIGTVIADTEIFSVSFENFAAPNDFREIALDYAISRKRYSSAGELQALKFAVLAVCKKRKITLHCSSLLDKEIFDQMLDKLRSQSSKLEGMPKTMMDLLSSENDEGPTGLERFKQALQYLRKEKVDTSQVSLNLLVAAGIEINHERDVAYAADSKWDWLGERVKASGAG